jgi:NADH dehydrogenase FAD-containing subunit
MSVRLHLQLLLVLSLLTTSARSQNCEAPVRASSSQLSEITWDEKGVTSLQFSRATDEGDSLEWISLPLTPGLRVAHFRDGRWIPALVVHVDARELLLQEFASGSDPQKGRPHLISIPGSAEVPVRSDLFEQALQSEDEKAVQDLLANPQISWTTTYGRFHYLKKNKEVESLSIGDFTLRGTITEIFDGGIRFQNSSQETESFQSLVANEVTVQTVSPQPLSPSNQRQRLWDLLETPWVWARQMLHNTRGILAVIDQIFVKKIPGGLYEPEHPFATGIDPLDGKFIWPKNLLYSTPRSAQFKLPPDSDEEILKKVGGLMVAMARKSARTLGHPRGLIGRMPHAVNYLHGAVQYHAGIVLFNNFQEALAHLSDRRFLAEVQRFIASEKREFLVVFRERNFSPEEFSILAGVIRSQLPFFTNTQGIVRELKKRDEIFVNDNLVMWGNPSPYPTMNVITGHWMDDVYKLNELRDKSETAGLIRPAISPHKYFQENYRGIRIKPQGPETFLALLTARRVRVRAKQGKGSLFFVDKRKLDREQANQKKREEFQTLKPESLVSESVLRSTLVIGAGAAGVSVAQQLEKQGVKTLVVEESSQVGSSFRRMPTNVKLLTPMSLNVLLDSPTTILPKEKFPTGERYAQYLVDYAQHFSLRILLNLGVQSVERKGAYWRVYFSDGQKADFENIVFAGGNSVPLVPEIPGVAHFKGPLLHSSDYRDPEHLARLLYPGREAEPELRQQVETDNPRVLIVGSGLTAGQAAEELLLSKFQIAISSRSGIPEASGPRRLPVSLVNLWERVQIIFGNRIHAHTQIRMSSNRVLIGVAQGEIPTYPEIQEILPDGSLQFKNGHREKFTAILWATGFSARKLPQQNGRELLAPVGNFSGAQSGLYFIGFDQVRTFRSRFLRGIREDALILAREIHSRPQGLIPSK